MSRTHLGVHPSRRPPKPQGRQGIWTAIRRYGSSGFCVADIRGATDIDKNLIADYLEGLLAEGYVSKEKRAGGTPRGRAFYRLVNDTGSEAPVIGPEAKLRDVLWHTMKMLSSAGDFSVRDLAVSARTPDVRVRDHDAKRYIGQLVKARYVAERGNNRFLLVNYTGPRAPIARRLDVVFDPNVNNGIGAIVWHGEAER